MQLKIIPLNVVEEKVHAQLFPQNGDYVTWIRTNNPDYPEFEASKVKLHLFPLEEDEWSLIAPELYESQIRKRLRDKDGFGGYDTVYVEVDMELLLQYTQKTAAIVRGPQGKRGPHIHVFVELDDVSFIKAWVEAGMSNPWYS